MITVKIECPTCKNKVSAVQYPGAKKIQGFCCEKNFTVEEISLWRISECVDFLREKGCTNYLYLLHCENPLEVCRKAVLAVLEEGK